MLLRGVIHDELVGIPDHKIFFLDIVENVPRLAERVGVILAVVFANRNLLDGDVEPKRQCQQGVLYYRLDASAVRLARLCWVSIRQEAEVFRVPLDLRELLFSPCRAKRCDGVICTYQVEPQHVGRTLDEIELVLSRGRPQCNVDSEDGVFLAVNQRGNRVEIFWNVLTV